MQPSEGQAVQGSTNNSTWMIGGDANDHEGDRAAFNRVVGDAPQRAHIRLKSRHHRVKGAEASDNSSDSSSYNRDSPPNVLNLPNLQGRAKQQDGNLESEGSSGSGIFFRPTQGVAKHLVKHGHGKMRKGDVSQSDAGIAACTCSGSSTSQQSGMSVSRDSSGQDAGDSGFGTRKSTSHTKSTSHSKRSLATHYQNIKRCCVDNDAETSNSSTLQMRTMSDSQPDSVKDKKRRRFNRTFAALRQCGLLDLTLQTATLMEQSQRMQKQLDNLRKETKILYSAMTQFSQTQPEFLQSNNAQQVMTGLEKIAKAQGTPSVQQILNDTKDTTTQLLNDALNLQRDQMLAAGIQGLSSEPFSDPKPKKVKQKHSGSSSQTLTSTSSPTTDSDELQKQYEEIQAQMGIVNPR